MNMPLPPEYLNFSSFDLRHPAQAGDCLVYGGRPSSSSAMPSLLFVAGGYHGAWCYSHYMDFFELHDVTCHAVDLPGHGVLAPQLRPDLDVGRMAEALVECCRLLEGPLVLVGHSVGALPVLLTAMQTQPVGVALLAPSPPGNLPGAQPLPALPANILKPAPQATEIRHRFLGVKGNIPVDALIARLQPESPAVLNDRYRLRIAIDPARMTCPGICFEAQFDDAERHPPGQDKAIARFLGFEHRIMPGQPHCMMYGPRWQDSAQALLDWLLDTYGPSGTLSLAGRLNADTTMKKETNHE